MLAVRVSGPGAMPEKGVTVSQPPAAEANAVMLCVLPGTSRSTHTVCEGFASSAIAAKSTDFCENWSLLSVEPLTFNRTGMLKVAPLPCTIREIDP